MQEIVIALQDAFTAPLETSLGNVAATITPLLDALIIFTVSLAALSSAMGSGSIVRPMFNATLNIVLARTVLEVLPTLMQQSLTTAAQLSGMGGAGEIGTPAEIAQVGSDTFAKAIDHATSWSQLVSSALQLDFALPFALLGVGTVIMLAFLWLTFVVLCAWVEFFAGGLLLSVLFCFMFVPAFQSTSAQPAGFIISATLRLAGLSFLAAFGAGLIAQTELVDIGGEPHWEDVGAGFAVAIGMWFLSWVIPRALNAWVDAKPGFNAAAAAVGAVVSSAATMTAMAGSLNSMGGASMRMSAGPSGGSAPSSPSASSAGGGGTVGTQSTPINARRP